MLTSEQVEAVRDALRSELAAQGFDVVPEDESALRSSLPFYRAAVELAEECRSRAA